MHEKEFKMNQNSTQINENTLNCGRPYQWERKARRPCSNRADYTEVGAGETGEDIDTIKHCPGCVLDFIWPDPPPETPIYLKLFVILRNTLSEMYWS
ncbi:hypothetical protein O3M35_010469 [Rhynocoris fuscipes]|uniref:Uncharacterized protein n=1 Tax=Rhynocoris fuscipes TaxID=488301 RepID=A0AAW1CZY8_9HEMI